VWARYYDSEHLGRGHAHIHHMFKQSYSEAEYMYEGVPRSNTAGTQRQIAARGDRNGSQAHLWVYTHTYIDGVYSHIYSTHIYRTSTDKNILSQIYMYKGVPCSNTAGTRRQIAARGRRHGTWVQPCGLGCGEGASVV